MSNSSSTSLYVAGRFHEAWLDLMDAQVRMGKTVSPRGIATRELIGVQIEVENYGMNVLTSPERNLNYKFMVAEFLWIAEGHRSLQSIAQFNSKYKELSDDGENLYGAYGPHWMAQKDYVIQKLQDDPFSRQAVMTFWNQNPQKSKDIPCTISLQFILREGDLHIVANMRSSDVWLGIPYDVYTFSQLGNIVASRLGVNRGNLTLQLGSSHMYESDRENAIKVLKVGAGVLRSPAINTSYTGSILLGKYDAPVVGLEEPWRTYAQILGRPRHEALEALTGVADL